MCRGVPWKGRDPLFMREQHPYKNVKYMCRGKGGKGLNGGRGSGKGEPHLPAKGNAKQETR
jgi:hypothetical protein